MTRRRLLCAAQRVALGLMAASAAAVVVTACSSKTGPVGAGGECFLATDCAPGLVCVEQRNKTRICTDDVSGVAGRPRPAPEPADAGDDGEAGQGGSEPVDGEAPDVVTPPPVDTGVPDVVEPPADTGAPPDDAGDQGDQ